MTSKISRARRLAITLGISSALMLLLAVVDNPNRLRIETTEQGPREFLVLSDGRVVAAPEDCRVISRGWPKPYSCLKALEAIHNQG